MLSRTLLPVLPGMANLQGPNGLTGVAGVREVTVRPMLPIPMAAEHRRIFFRRILFAIVSAKREARVVLAGVDPPPVAGLSPGVEEAGHVQDVHLGLVISDPERLDWSKKQMFSVICPYLT